MGLCARAEPLATGRAARESKDLKTAKIRFTQRPQRASEKVYSGSIRLALPVVRAWRRVCASPLLVAPNGTHLEPTLSGENLPAAGLTWRARSVAYRVVVLGTDHLSRVEPNAD